MAVVSQEVIQARKEEIVAACERLYRTRSFKEITLKEIGEVTSCTRTSIYNYFQTKEEIFLRDVPTDNVTDIVKDIIDDVVKNGDEALYRYEEKFDHVRLTSLKVSEEEFEEALRKTEPEFLEILKKAASNIKRFHENQKRTGFILNDEDGIVMGQKVIPLSRVGLYVPGGTAVYPSTVLMDSIPAKLAGVKDVCIVTPPGRDGKIAPAILAAAKIAGVDNIYKVGGAQAVAALAYGTKSIPKADKIVGPGNAFVAEAKRQVFGRVAIDMIAGPSEILLIADKNTNPAHAAADMLSQAEHDKNASAVMITECEELAKAVRDELEKQIALLPRSEIARASIDNNGKIIV
ncbi:MAG: histidinol dehydrogenase, partial [Oscillospiraceae bacterium]|nr:histidinol dehydrogenase [Oscillospiraceae bacterium]